MDGPSLHRVASKLLPPLVERVVAASGRRMDDLHVVPHQASGPSVEAMIRRLRLPRERTHVSLAEHGNMVAASIPYALHRAGERIPAGSPLLLLGTAAGYAQAAMVLTR
jgi:3-oxoacyl-[acyl-carrier-protein] synthase-3